MGANSKEVERAELQEYPEAVTQIKFLVDEGSYRYVPVMTRKRNCTWMTYSSSYLPN